MKKATTILTTTAIGNMQGERSMTGFAGQPLMLVLAQQFIDLTVVLGGSVTTRATAGLIASKLQWLCF